MGSNGVVLGSRFLIERPVAAGGMGDVYRGRDQRSGAAVALKVLRDQGDDTARRFLREVETLESIHHPAIVRYVAHGNDGSPFLAMEWVDGRDLGAILAGGALPLSDVRLLANRLAEALACMHQHGLVHRDLKPGNILVPDAGIGEAKLVDFGLARGARSIDVTLKGQVMGTPGYVAPEQLRGEQSDPRADVFALGCVLYECLTGAPAFHGPNVVATLSKILLESPVPIEALRPEVPAAFANLVMRMLSKARAARPASGEALLAELADLDNDLAMVVARHPEMSREERILSSIVVVTIDPAKHPDIAELVRSHGARIEAEFGETILVACPVTPDAGSVVGAARAALGALGIDGVRAVSISTVHAEPYGVGRAIDRAAAAAASPSSGAVIVDDVTRSILPPRFEVVARGDSLLLLRERDALDVPRRVFGRELPMRERECELDALVARTIDRLQRKKSGAVLITSPTGYGRLLARTSRACTGHDAARIARVLAETIGVVPAPEGASPAPLRHDPALLHELARRAFSDLLAAETAIGPVLVVLEDLQWADPPSLALLGAALRACSDRPVVVFAIGLPAVRERIAAWPEGAVFHSIEVPELTRAGAAAVATSVLGDSVSREVIDQIAERSLGVPLFVEELSLGVRDGIEPDLSRPLIALVEARLLGISREARRIARAAALVGTTFWRGAVAALVPRLPSSTLDVELAALEEAGWFVEHGTSRFRGERELSFRHDVMREAAEALNTEEDRALGHAVIGRWLESSGELDPGYVAAHYARAGLEHVAAEHFARSAENALAAADPASAIERAGRGLSCATDGRVIGWLSLVEARARRARGELKLATSCGRAAMRAFEGLAGPRDDRWFDAAAEAADAASSTKDLHASLDVVEALTATTSEDRPGAAQIAAIQRVARCLVAAGLKDEAAPLAAWLRRVEAHPRPSEAPPPQTAIEAAPPKPASATQPS